MSSEHYYKNYVLVSLLNIFDSNEFIEKILDLIFMKKSDCLYTKTKFENLKLICTNKEMIDKLEKYENFYFINIENSYFAICEKNDKIEIMTNSENREFDYEFNKLTEHDICFIFLNLFKSNNFYAIEQQLKK